MPSIQSKSVQAVQKLKRYTGKHPGFQELGIAPIPNDEDNPGIDLDPHQLRDDQPQVTVAN